MPSMGALQHLLHVKLTHTNYLMWRNQLGPLINCFKINSLIDPSIKPSSEFFVDKECSCCVVPNSEFMQWRKKDPSVVFVCGGDPKHHRFTNVIGSMGGSSVGLWCIHKSEVGPTQHPTAEFQEKRLACSCVSSTSKTDCRWLAAAGRPIHPSSLNASIFNNLEPNISEVVSALAMHGRGLLSFTELSSALVSHEIRPNHNRAVELAEAQSPEANFTQLAGGRAMKGRGGGRTGQKSGAPTGRTGGRRRDPCPICSSFDHSRYKCPHKLQAAASVRSSALVLLPSLPAAYVVFSPGSVAGGSAARGNFFTGQHSNEFNGRSSICGG